MKRYVLICLVSATMIMGCGIKKISIKNYEGPVLPSEQLAIIKPQVFAIIHAIDGDPSKKFIPWKDFGSEDADIAILPGAHTFEVSYKSLKHSSTILAITYEFQAGHRYLLGYTYTSKEVWKPVITDVTNNPEQWCIIAPNC